jgi:hypothetical protein
LKIIIAPLLTKPFHNSHHAKNVIPDNLALKIRQLTCESELVVVVGVPVWGSDGTWVVVGVGGGVGVELGEVLWAVW